MEVTSVSKPKLGWKVDSGPQQTRDQLSKMFVWPVFLSATLLLTIFDDVGVMCSSKLQKLSASKDVSPVGKAAETRKRSFTDTGDEKPKYNLTYCSFNFNLCGFEDYKSGNPQVTRKTHITHRYSQPMVDRTWGTASIGSFMAVNYKSYPIFNSKTDRGSPATTATIKSPFFAPEDNYCLRFWYNINHFDHITINVATEIEHGISSSVLQLGRTKFQWKLAQFDFDEEYSALGLKILFTFLIPERGRGITPQPYAGIDDFYMYNIPCSNVPRHPETEYTYSTESSISYYTFHVQPKNWQSAYTACREQGAMSFLVSVETQEEQRYLVRKIKNDAALSQAGKKGGFYTSGNDIGLEDTFIWSGRLENKKFSYTNWRAGQPNNVKGNQDCVVLQYWEEDYTWGDKDCAKPLPFICEVNIPTGGDGEYIG